MILKRLPQPHKLFVNEAYFLRSESTRISKAVIYPPLFHHKREKQNFFKLTKIEMTVDEDLKDKITKGKNGVSRVDKQYMERHATAIKNPEERGMSQKEIAEVFGYTQTATLNMFKGKHPGHF